MVATHFRIPEVPDNPDGWGPTTVPEHLQDVPYASFNKADKVGRVSDFTQSGFRLGGRNDRGYGAPLTPVFNFFANEEEDSFHLVDNRPTTRPKGPRRFQPNRFQRRDQNDKRGEPADRNQQRRQQKGGRGQPWYRNDQRQTQYTSSVDIRPDWTMVEQINFTVLAKLNFSPGDPEDLLFCGTLEYYDKIFDRVTPKAEKRLEKTKRVYKNLTASEDPILKKLREEGKAKIFATDTVLTALMCAPRSVYPWDLVVAKSGDCLFLDKRPGSFLEQLAVAETAPEPIPEDKDNINGVQQLAAEATAINLNFSQQVLMSDGEKFECGAPNPFAEDGVKLTGTAYRYRKWSLSDDMDIVVRCELDGVMNFKGQDALLAIKTLNEFDSKFTGVDWRQKLDSQRGAVLATELKNNACKLARWTAQALISGVDMFKLGYVSRVAPRDNGTHAILGTQNMKPRDFAMQINLNMDNCWGIVRALVDLLMKQEDGKYLLIKDPNKPVLRLYTVPAEAFEMSYAEEPLEEEEVVEEETVGNDNVQKAGDDEDE